MTFGKAGPSEQEKTIGVECATCGATTIPDHTAARAGWCIGNLIITPFGSVRTWLCPKCRQVHA
jgi:hypothetical protein